MCTPQCAAAICGLPASRCSEAKSLTMAGHVYASSAVHLLVEHTMRLEELPTDISSKIFELLSTTERAKLSVLSQGLRNAIKASWTSITLHCSNDEEIMNQTLWINGISNCLSQTLQTLQWQAMPTQKAYAAPATSGMSSVLLSTLSHWSE